MATNRYFMESENYVNFGPYNIYHISLISNLFGLGPVLLADGVLTERLFFLGVVILIYAVLIVAYRMVLKRIK